MARFRGNVNAGSDRAAATFLFLVLLVVLLMAAWWIADPDGFMGFWNGVRNALD